LSTCDFTQIGNEIVFIIGRDGVSSYDPVHGSILHVAEDSLPDGIDEVTVTRKHGYNSCKLHSSMQVCSATVYFETKPSIKFTKDVFIELPHSFSSIDTQELCFVKYDCDMDSTGICLGGLFPPEYPYGIITTRTFSAYKISTKKRLQSNNTERKSYIYNLRPRFHNEPKITESKKSLSIRKQAIPNTVNHGFIPNTYWFGITESDDRHTIFLSLSQFTPTGYKVTVTRAYMKLQGWSSL